MKRLWTRDWLAWALLGWVTLALTGLYIGLREIGLPYGRFVLDLNYSNQHWYVQEIPPWWPSLPGAGNLFLRLDDQPIGISSYPGTFAAARANSRLTVKVTRDYYGQETEFEVPVVTYTVGDFLDLHGPYLVNGAAALILALYVYRADPTQTRNRAFAMLFGVLGCQQVLVRLSVFSDVDVFSWFQSLASVTIVMQVAPLACLRFAYEFPERLSTSVWARRLLVGLFCADSAASAAAAVAISIPRIALWLGLWTPTIGLLDTAVIQFFSLNLVIGVSCIVARFAWIALRPQSIRLRRDQAGPILIAFLLIGPVLVPQILRYSGLVPTTSAYWGLWDTRFMYGLVPLSCAYIALRHKTFWSVSPRFLGLVSFVASAVLASLVDAAIRALGETRLAIQPVWILLPVFWLGTQLIVALMTRRGAFGRGVNWQAFGYQDLATFSQSLAAQRDVSQLAASVPPILVNGLEFGRAALWRRTTVGNDLMLLSASGFPPEEAGPPPRVAIEREHPAPEGTGQWGGVLMDFSLPLRDPQDQRIVGLLGVARRQDEGVFDDRDRRLLEQVGQQTLLALLMAEQLSQVRESQAYALSVEERERIRMARELHDTVQQFLAGLVYMTENMRAIAREDAAALEPMLSQTIEEARKADHDMRAILRDLTSEQLKDGLVPTLRGLAATFHRRTGIHLELSVDPVADAGLGMPRRVAVYRVIQQALDNVARHAKATRVDVRLSAEPRSLRFCVMDNGTGAAQANPGNVEGHFGLRFMAQRLEEHGGTLQVSFGRDTGQVGTVVEGWVPREGPVGEL